VVDRRRERHETRKAAIVEAAWELARQNGLAGISLRELAARVELRQPSLYSYFSSKMALYDAMFAEGNRQLVERMESLELPDDPRDAIKAFARELMEFDVEDPTRSQLLFQRTIPGFVPSPDSYVVAIRFDEFASSLMRQAGMKTPQQRDLFVALMAGLSSSQQANDPGGRRWVVLVDRAVDMWLREITPKNRRDNG
jgi:AcrR family transcriptional regulator